MKLQVLVPATPKKVEDIFLRDLGPDTTPIPMAAAQPAKPAPTPLAGVRRKDEPPKIVIPPIPRSEEHTSELQSLLRISYAVFCLKKNIHLTASHIKSTTYCTSS